MKQSKHRPARKNAARRFITVLIYGLVVLILLGAPQKIRSFLRERDYVVFGTDLGTLLHLSDAKAPAYYTADGVSFEIPRYEGEPFSVINGGVPFFSQEDMTAEFFERYSDLDRLGRCGAAFACLHRSHMAPGEREEIREIRPTGFRNREYEFLRQARPSLIPGFGETESFSGGWLYNRCHLIAYRLTGQNANEKNLITGTQYLNFEGMLPFEKQVIDFLTDNADHVMYRVTPVFEGNDLVASGVLMEARSVEDAGRGLCFCVFCHNVQPGVRIDYATGESRANP